jgi:hypothetical protein
MVLYTCTFEFSVWCCRETVLRWDVGLLEFPKEGSDLGFANYDTTGHPSCSV